MKVKIKKLHPDAVIPKYAKDGDAGMDLVATSKGYDEFGNIYYGTGLAIEVPKHYEAEIRPRSSISKYELILVNSPGTIDSGYRGEIIVKFRMLTGGHNKTNTESTYGVGDKIAQLLIKPAPEFSFEEVEELSETERGDGGFGHTGK